MKIFLSSILILILCLGCNRKDQTGWSVTMKKKRYFCLFISLVSICFGVGQPALAEDQPGLSVGETIYYSGN